MKRILGLFGVCLLVGAVLALIFRSVGAYGASLGEIAIAAVIAAVLTALLLTVYRAVSNA